MMNAEEPLKIRTVLIEDAPYYVRMLRSKLALLCPQVEVVGDAGHLETAYQLIRREEPDLVLFDIELSDGKSFDVLARLHAEDAITFQLAFLTGFGQAHYVTQALDYSALRFLNKPLEDDELSAFLQEQLPALVGKASRELVARQRQRQIGHFVEQLTRQQNRRTTIALHRANNILEIVTITDILYLESDGPVSEVFLTDERRMKVMRGIGFYARLLIANHNFFQISNQLLVNLDHLHRYDHAEKAVQFRQGAVLYASRRGGKDLHDHLLRTQPDDAPAMGLALEKLLKWFGGK
jgi:two-component system, LytTR family, response regulator